VPSDITQLTAGRQLTGMRQVLDCPATATKLRQGPATAPGEPPDWTDSHSCAPPTPRHYPSGRALLPTPTGRACPADPS
jgi:hypothetical protein